MSRLNTTTKKLASWWALFRRWPTWARVLTYVGTPILVIAVTLGIFTLVLLRKDVPEVHADITDHFMYGSIGSEAGAGVPYELWKVLPDVFPELLPDRPGTGYERFGFIYESPQHDRPIGTSYREKPVGLVGLNCAVCHVGTVRESVDSETQIILGKPAQSFDLQAYARFLFAVGQDQRFNADVLMPAIKDANPDMSMTQRILYRYIVISRTRDALVRQAEQFAWMDSRPDSGPGRVDTFNPFHEFFGLEPANNEIVGTAALPSIWNQSDRVDMNLHWDGNNSSVDERNINAAIGAGAIKDQEDRIDLDGINRIAAWTLTELHPPSFPQQRIDAELAGQGELVFQIHCAACHAPGGEYVGQVTDISEIGTDRERLDSFTEELVTILNMTGEGKEWEYSHFKKTNGYANMLLDGIWLRGPYLHNGSVPTLHDLMSAPEDRPDTFYTGIDLYDFEGIGYISSGAYAENNGELFDTRLRGNGNYGHEYGLGLTEAEKTALIEFLKTL